MWYWQDYSSMAPSELKLCVPFLDALRLASLERYIFLKDIAGLEEAPDCVKTSFFSSYPTFEALDWLQTVLIDHIAYFQSGHTAISYNTIEENLEIFSVGKLMRHLRIYENHYGLPNGSLGEDLFMLKRGGLIDKAWLFQKYHILNILNSFRTELAWGEKSGWSLSSYAEDSSCTVVFDNRTSYQVQCELIVEPYESWHEGLQRLNLWPWPAKNQKQSYSFGASQAWTLVPVAGKLMPLFDYGRYWWPSGSWYVNPS